MTDENQLVQTSLTDQLPAEVLPESDSEDSPEALDEAVLASTRDDSVPSDTEAVSLKDVSDAELEPEIVISGIDELNNTTDVETAADSTKLREGSEN